MHELGICYQYGKGCEIQPTLAFECFTKAAKSNNSGNVTNKLFFLFLCYFLVAMYNLAYCYGNYYFIYFFF